MADHDKDGPATGAKAGASVGEGGRSLSNWQRLSTARQGGGDDVHALLATYGIDSAAFAGGETAALSSLEKRLAFSGEVERDTLGIHRGAALVVGPVALAVAGVVAGVGAAVCAAAAAGNVAYAVNAAQTANVAWTTNWVSGDKVYDLPDPFNSNDSPMNPQGDFPYNPNGPQYAVGRKSST